MRALDISGFAGYIAGTPIELDSLWLKQLDSISQMDIQLFYARAKTAEKRLAYQAIEALQSELLVEAANGRISGSQLRVIAHEVPSERHTADEFVSRLMQLSQPRRQAILFALSTSATPKQVASMEWVTMSRQALPPGLPREIMKGRMAIRHLRLPYVFWEFATEVIAAPLLKLTEDAEAAFSASWPTVQAMWTELIWVSPRTEASSLLATISEVRSGRL